MKRSYESVRDRRIAEEGGIGGRWNGNIAWRITQWPEAGTFLKCQAGMVTVTGEWLTIPDLFPEDFDFTLKNTAFQYIGTAGEIQVANGITLEPLQTLNVSITWPVWDIEYLTISLAKFGRVNQNGLQVADYAMRIGF